MEQLRSSVPEAVVAEIDSALKSSDPAAACAALASFFSGPGKATLAQATEALVETAPERSPCAKDPQQAEERKQEGNASYKRREYIEAAHKYTKALQFLSPTASPHETAVCFANRAATLQAQAQREAAAGSREAGEAYREAAERDCSRALRWEPRYTKALFRRGCLRAEGGQPGQLAGAQADLEAALALECATPGQGSVKQIEEMLADVRRRAGAGGGSGEKGGLGVGVGKGKKKRSTFAFPSKEGKAGAQGAESADREAQSQSTPGSGAEPVAQGAGAGAGAEGEGSPGPSAAEPVAQGAGAGAEGGSSPGPSAAQAQQALDPQPRGPWKEKVTEATEYGGRGLFSTGEVEAGEEVLQEEAYAGVLLKPLRHTHCHWCFLRLPPGPLACPRCAVPLYCSEACQLRAGAGEGQGEGSEGTVPRDSSAVFGEHAAECGGAAWAAALPLEATLASRVVCRELFEEAQGGGEALLKAEDRLLHHLDKRPLDPPEGFLSLALLACTTAHCLLASPHLPAGRLTLPSQVTGQDGGEGNPFQALSWRLLRALGALRVNAIGISCLVASTEGREDAGPACVARGEPAALKQETVAQALFLTASGFNHSCHPNCHLNFHGRTLSACCLEPGPPRTPLHICYGPQMAPPVGSRSPSAGAACGAPPSPAALQKGEMTAEERQQVLAAKYRFACACRACAPPPPEPLGGPSLPAAGGTEHPVGPRESSDTFFHALRCREAQCGGALASLARSEDGKGGDGSGGGGVRGTEGVAEKGAALAPPVKCLTCGSAKGYATGQAVAKAQQAAANTLALLLTCTEGEPSPKALEAASKHLHFLERLLHPMNRDLAKAHDAVAKLSLRAGRPPQEALHHEREALKVLEFHYPPGSLQLAEEYLKCSSLNILCDPDITNVTWKEHSDRALRIQNTHYGRGPASWASHAL